MCVFHNSDTILLIYSFIHSLYSFIMRTRSKNRLHDGAVSVAADAALAEASLELPPTNNPAHAASADPSLRALVDANALGCGTLALKAPTPADNNAGAALADANALALGSGEVEVPADNNADAAADASLAGNVALLEAPPADNNAGAAKADADTLGRELEVPVDNADAAADVPLVMWHRWRPPLQIIILVRHWRTPTSAVVGS
jgi:hypothetical protein